MARQAIVVGGGIGGLAACVALERAGWKVDLFERQPEFSEIGASLTIWPNALAALGYDAVKLVADATQRAGRIDRDAIRDAIEKTEGFSGVTGQITIDKQHNAVKSAVVVKVETRNGKAHFPLVTTIAP